MTSLPAAPRPAAATSVADVLAAEALLHGLDGLDEAAYQARRRAITPELLAATAVIERAHLAEEAVIETDRAAAAQYGIQLLCNVDEERLAPFDDLVAEFVADGARRHGQPEPAIRPRLLRADLAEMLARALLLHYRCPPTAVRLSAPGNPPTLPLPVTP